jgi:hypothetical protein
MKSSPQFLANLLAFCLLTSCATQPLNTTSGRPEVTIQAVTAAKARNVIVSHFVDHGWAPVDTNGNQLVFEREGSFGQSFAMGLLTNNPQSKIRLIVTLIEGGNNLRVVGGVAVLGQNTFGKQEVVELNGKGYQQLQAELQVIKNKVEKAR